VICTIRLHCVRSPSRPSAERARCNGKCGTAEERIDKSLSQRAGMPQRSRYSNGESPTRTTTHLSQSEQPYSRTAKSRMRWCSLRRIRSSGYPCARGFCIRTGRTGISPNLGSSRSRKMDRGSLESLPVAFDPVQPRSSGESVMSSTARGPCWTSSRSRKMDRGSLESLPVAFDPVQPRSSGESVISSTARGPCWTPLSADPAHRGPGSRGPGPAPT